MIPTPQETTTNEAGNNALVQLRLRVLTRILWVALLFGAASGVVAGLTELHAGGRYIGLFYLALYFLGVVAGFVERLGYTVRASLFLTILYLLALSELWMYGATGMADAALFAFVVFGGVFFSFRVGIFALGLALASMAVMGYLHGVGVLSVAISPLVLSREWQSWVSSGATLTFLTGAALAMVSLLLRKLEQSEAHFRSLIENSSDVITVFDEEGNVTYTSPAVSRVLGHFPQVCVGKNFFDWLHPDDIARVREDFTRTVAAKAPQAIECRLRHKDGSWISVEAVGKRIAENRRPVAWVINFRDITEREKAQEKLRLSQTRTHELNRLLTLLHEVTHELAAVEDVDELCRQAVILGREKLGFDRLGIWLVEEGEAEARGTFGTDEQGNVRDERQLRIPGWNEWISEPLADKNIAFELQRDTELRWEDELIGRADYTRASLWSGDKIVGFLSADNLLTHAPMTDERNRILALYASALGHLYSIRRMQDERKHLQLQLQHSQRMEAIGQLAGGVAHDFNNLLQAVQGYTDMAMQGLPPDGSAYADLVEAGKATERAGKLVHQLLAFSRREIIQPKHLDLAEVVGNLTTMLRRLIGEHIELSVIHAPDLKLVYVDPGQVEQVLLNLCVNARDAMPDGGRITIETSNAQIGPEHKETHPWSKEGEYVLLAVSDTGTGMTQEVTDRVFEPFFTTKEVGKGTGMGLATVYGIVKQHGGMIHAYSELGHGTAFRVYLPVSEQTGPVDRDTVAVPEPVRGGEETILLAEDDELVRNVAVRILKTSGYRVLCACDGAEASRLFEQHANDIDLFILDVVMPKQSGRAVYDRIRAARPEARVLFTSGYSYKALEASSLPADGFELIQKPYAPSDLLRKVRAQLDTGGK